MKKAALFLIACVASVTILAGCGGSSSSSSDDAGGGGATSRTISGTATAPAGAVAFHEAPSLFELALNVLIPPAHAAITGLDPVGGATVELLRVDNAGNPVGEVLAETVTSITGDYRLTLPDGVNLAGNLIVRITGTGTEMRAQVVDQAVNINPVSEFVLRKFIEEGTDLDQLVATDVVTLSGKVDTFDLTAGNDLSDMLAKLDQEVGEFVEQQVAVIKAQPGDADSVTGDYRSAAFSLGLHDSDNDNFGTFANDMWRGQFDFADGGGNTVAITLEGEESAYSNFSGMSVATGSIYYETDIDTESENLSGTLTDSGILSIEGAFEEEINGDNAFRYPSVIYNLQQVQNTGLFFLLSQEAAVRYGTTDTNGDDEPDALNPDDRQGDEVFRALEVFARSPSGMSDSDLSGAFGRVFLETYAQTGVIELQTEVNVVTFNGDGTFDYGDATGHRVGLESNGSTYQTLSETGSTGDAINVSADGDIISAGTEDGQPVPTDGFINDTFDFIAFAETENNENIWAQFNKTLMVKLPDSAPDVSGKRYRLMLLSVALDGVGNGSSDIEMINSQFNSYVNLTSNTAGTLNGSFTLVEKTGLGGDLVVEQDTVDEPLTASIAANGATTLTLAGQDGSNIMEGFFNQDASLGVFTTRWVPQGGDPNELGLVVLIDVTE
ncbi:MAG TPA: hypothetical protein DEB61_06705 [Alcanivorax sp.]|jgi:hypothetical protein|uniref:hypothetical protein n=2 Tax=Alloalcanivorax venustensis TaxID=172371 RepID=UPI00079944DB|nr:MAG: hypothetical protein AXW13_04185 [Alcanivorax sp. Nap_24]MBA4731786.1 hypothetical protein [Alcanivorax sp.]SMO59200.1 hypothetical protein SAMN06272769_10669 [Alcanivorax sp. DSM 26295]MBF48741.1 hypothetical protein [Alcanivorax sp.]MCH2551686.1 hypothetical protein [Alcanivorax sp.]|tara:strand:- start:53783 stop:55783 length:2001 start_codon:yes stop_codon:yes gene_type:complete